VTTLLSPLLQFSCRHAPWVSVFPSINCCTNDRMYCHCTLHSVAWKHTFVSATGGGPWLPRWENVCNSVHSWYNLSPCQVSRYVVPMYIVRQFNSGNGIVKAKCTYLCSSSWCSLRNTFLAKLCTSSDGGTTAGNSLQNRFPEYLTVMLSRCVGYQECQQIFLSAGRLFFNFGRSRKSQEALSSD
jgi:hypothetical protein